MICPHCGREIDPAECICPKCKTQTAFRLRDALTLPPDFWGDRTGSRASALQRASDPASTPEAA
ncbi:MAG: hypothetical protein GX418_09310, partial [Clostridiales bacterium]|nr:hypothetical protein [Clostridiales bacterium]